jgi:hypothetical protein
VVAEPERLRRRSVLAPATEGAALELFVRDRLELREPGAWPAPSAGRDQDAPPGERILADRGQRLVSPSPRTNGPNNSIGNGRINVDVRSELISSIVCR